MVISKDGKRKRKEPPILELSPEVPKRFEFFYLKKKWYFKEYPKLHCNLFTIFIFQNKSSCPAKICSRTEWTIFLIFFSSNWF